MKWAQRVTCGLVGGLIVYLALTVPKLDFDTKFSIASVLQLIVTLVIALIVQNFLSHRYSEFRIEKDLILSKLKEIEDLSKGARAVFTLAYAGGQLTEPQSKELKNILRNLANTVLLVERLFNECRPNSNKTRFQTLKNSISTTKRR
jgi:hypothetical protein